VAVSLIAAPRVTPGEACVVSVVAARLLHPSIDETSVIVTSVVAKARPT
jgi:hypothetical protein